MPAFAHRRGASSLHHLSGTPGFAPTGHTMGQAGKDHSGSSGATSLSHQGHPRAQDCFQMVLEYPQWGRLLILSGQSDPGLHAELQVGSHPTKGFEPPYSNGNLHSWVRLSGLTTLPKPQKSCCQKQPQQAAAPELWAVAAQEPWKYYRLMFSNIFNRWLSAMIKATESLILGSVHHLCLEHFLLHFILRQKQITCWAVAIFQWFALMHPDTVSWIAALHKATSNSWQVH